MLSEEETFHDLTPFLPSIDVLQDGSEVTTFLPPSTPDDASSMDFSSYLIASKLVLLKVEKEQSKKLKEFATWKTL